MPSNSYSRDDWNGMLQGSYISLLDENRSVMRVSDVVVEAGRILLVGARINYDEASGRCTVSSHSVEVAESNFQTIFDWGRRPAKIVRNYQGELFAIRPNVRRTRVKGVSPRELSVTRLSDGAYFSNMGEVFTTADTHYIIYQMYKDIGSTSIRNSGAFGIVDHGRNLPEAVVENAEHLPDDVRRIVGLLAMQMGRVNVDAARLSTEMRDALRSFASVVGVNPDSRSIYYLESRIASVEGDEVRVDERADALIPVIASSFPELVVSQVAHMES